MGSRGFVLGIGRILRSTGQLIYASKILCSSGEVSSLLRVISRGGGGLWSSENWERKGLVFITYKYHSSDSVYFPWEVHIT